MGIAKLLTDRVAGFWSKEYDIKDFTLSSVVGDIYTFRLNANSFSLDISYDRVNSVITDYVVVSGELVDNESLLMLNLTDLISQGIMNSEVSDTVFNHMEFINASIAQYLSIVNSASELIDDLDNKNTTLLSTIETAVDQTEIIEQITNSISSSSLNTVANNISKIEDVISLEPKMDYTKNTLEPKMNNVIYLEDKITDITAEPLRQSIIDAEYNAGIAISKANDSSSSALSSKLDMWISEANKKTSDSYATEPEDVLVKIYTSNGNGTFNYTNSTEYSALHYAIKALELVTDGVIDDETASDLKTYSSNKILDVVADQIDDTIAQADKTYSSDKVQTLHDAQAQAIANLSGANASFYNNSTTAISESPDAYTDLTWTTGAQSSNTDIFELGTNEIVFKRDGIYTFLNTLTYYRLGSGATCVVNYEIYDADTNSVIASFNQDLDLVAGTKETVPMNASLTLTGITTTKRVKVRARVTTAIAGTVELFTFNSLLALATVTEVVTGDAIDDYLGSLITGVLI